VPTIVLWALVVLWTIPSFGLLVTSLRPREDQFGSGWWNAITDPNFTLDNYSNALFDPPGGSVPFSDAFINSFAIAIPGTLVPSPSPQPPPTRSPGWTSRGGTGSSSPCWR
jgi:alpha-glucoside transport system permease protein